MSAVFKIKYYVWILKYKKFVDIEILSVYIQLCKLYQLSYSTVDFPYLYRLLVSTICAVFQQQLGVSKDL